MEGTKAIHLEEWARAKGRAFLRFDYSGHGQSSGSFEEGCIGDWAEDTRTIIYALIEGPIVAVGSSMGGWQALLLARHMPEERFVPSWALLVSLAPTRRPVAG